MTLLRIAALAAFIASAAGCGSLSLMNGALTLEMPSDQPAARRLLKRAAVQQLVERLEAAETQSADSLDPNKRAAANCAGGVCVIF